MRTRGILFLSLNCHRNFAKRFPPPKGACGAMQFDLRGRTARQIGGQPLRSVARRPMGLRRVRALLAASVLAWSTPLLVPSPSRGYTIMYGGGYDETTHQGGGDWLSTDTWLPHRLPNSSDDVGAFR